MFPLLKYTAEEVDEYYAKVTPEMVKASLAKDRHDWFDLLNLVSPAAYPFMDEMRVKARRPWRRTRQKGMSAFIVPHRERHKPDGRIQQSQARPTLKSIKGNDIM